MITFVFGTRPEAIKLAPLINLFVKEKAFKTRVISTGQHKDLIKDIINFFEIKIDNDLNLMKPDQKLSYLTSAIINSLEIEFSNYRPNMIIVQGDTTSAFAAALSSFYLKIPIGHVEAGLRTDNLFEPYPEEANRRLISQIADMHFAPTKRTYQNLKKNGITKNVYITGNTVIDSLLYASNKVDKFNFFDFDIKNKKILLATIHRRENWGDKLYDISKGIKKVLDNFPNTILLLPMHPNEKVRGPIKKILEEHPQAFLLEPLSYEKLVFALKICFLVITDSGGLQEEAPALDKPVLVLRNITERQEAIEAGSSKLLGTNSNAIFNGVKSLIMDKKAYSRMSSSINPFGEGDSSKKIFELISKRFNIQN
mgnify:CR=1 FL=1